MDLAPRHSLVLNGGLHADPRRQRRAGEHATTLRRRAAEGLGFLGVAIDQAGDDTTDAEITATDAAVRTFVITAREDLEIAAGVRRLLGV